MPLHLITGNPNKDDNSCLATEYVQDMNERFSTWPGYA